LLTNLELIAYIGALHSALLACALVFMPQGNSTSNRLLAGLLAVSGTYLLIAGIGNRPEFLACYLNELASWMALSFGPLLWLYVCSITDASFTFRVKQWLHLLPTVPCLLLISYDLESGFCASTPNRTVGMLITILVVVSMTVYCLLSLAELKRHRQDVEQVVSTVEWNYVFWLRIFVGAIFAFIAFGIVGAVLWELQAMPLFGTGLRIAVFNYLLCYLVVVEALFHPEIFSGRYLELLRLKEQHLSDTAVQAAGEPAERPSSKYQRSGLSEEAMNDYWLRARQHLDDHQLYLHPEMRISLLADGMGVSINHLSQAINVAGGTSFYELINRYRIEHAKNLLNDSTQDYKSVIDIGMASGFNSQSAFYKAFNRIEGTTPARFRKSRAAT
jgi:AraC-like DNA-binding protein